jgi:hypothetical protein
LPKFLKFNLEGFEYTLPVNIATLHYVSSESSPKKQWKFRGMKGHDRNLDRLEEQSNQLLKKYVEAREFPSELRCFLDGVLKIFNLLREDPSEVIERYFPEQNFVFVIGQGRTGGTYLLKNLMKIRDLDLETFNLNFIHDQCPSYNFLRRLNFSSKSHERTLFELAQLLEWMRIEFDSHPVIFKKRIAFAHAIPFLDEVFGSRATYLITVRHPIPSLRSFLELEYDPVSDEKDMSISEMMQSKKLKVHAWKQMVLERLDLDSEQWTQLPMYKKYLVAWKAFYEDIVRNESVQGELRALEFGSQYERYLEDVKREEAFSGTIESFKPTERDHRLEGDMETVDNIIGQVQEHWKNKGYEFVNFEEYK